MDNPQLYVLVGEGDEKADWVVLSNFDWGKEEAQKVAKRLLIPQRIYKLVPVYEVGIKTVHEFQIKNLEPVTDRRDWDEADRQEAERGG